jgi:hypothetical protein
MNSQAQILRCGLTQSPAGIRDGASEVEAA